MQGLVSRADAGCQTEGSWTATAEQLQEARAEGSALQKEVSSLRHALLCLPLHSHSADKVSQGASSHTPGSLN